MSPSSEKIVRENSAEKHKHSQLGSQKTEPISAWKVFFRWLPGEIYARKLIFNQPLVFRIALKAERLFLAAGFFLEAVAAKWGRERPLESKLKRLAGKNKLVKENAAA